MSNLHNNKTCKRWSLKGEQTDVVEHTEYKNGRVFLTRTKTNVTRYEFVWTEKEVKAQ